MLEADLVQAPRRACAKQKSAYIAEAAGILMQRDLVHASRVQTIQGNGYPVHRHEIRERRDNP